MLRASLFLLAAACAPSPAPVDAPSLIALGTLQPSGVRGAVVVHGDRIDAVTDEASARALAGPDTVVVESEQVTAGFVDAHAHLIGLGRSLSELRIADGTTYADTLAAIVAAKPESGWLTGRGWDQNDWPDAPAGGWPTAADLDARLGDTPVALRRVDGHAVWVSGAVLRAAGIDADTPDPEGGRIIRDAGGVPTGVLVDGAMDLIEAPSPTAEQLASWIDRGQRAAVESGLTGVHLMGASDAGIAALEAAQLDLRLRVYADPSSAAAERLVASGPWGNDMLRVVGVKQYGDGALGSRGAWLSSDYADEPGNRGLPMVTDEALAAQATALLGSDAQLAVHAIGDATVTQVLDAYEAARKAHPDATLPLRIEHAQVVRPEDRARFASLGVIASMQPTHATSDMPWAEARLGHRVEWAYTWRSLADAGATLAFGSDFPVEQVDPGLGLWSATTRAGLDRKPAGGWTPGERVTIDEAIAGFTSGAATAVGESDRFGQLAPGYAADLTLWRVEDGRWRATATVVAGKLRWKE